MSSTSKTTSTAGTPFRKALASGGSDNCVEVALIADRIHVRHSKDTSGTEIAFTLAEWRAFLDGGAIVKSCGCDVLIRLR